MTRPISLTAVLTVAALTVGCGQPVANSIEKATAPRALPGNPTELLSTQAACDQLRVQQKEIFISSFRVDEMRQSLDRVRTALAPEQRKQLTLHLAEEATADDVGQVNARKEIYAIYAEAFARANLKPDQVETFAEQNTDVTYGAERGGDLTIGGKPVRQKTGLVGRAFFHQPQKIQSNYGPGILRVSLHNSVEQGNYVVQIFNAQRPSPFGQDLADFLETRLPPACGGAGSARDLAQFYRIPAAN